MSERLRYYLDDLPGISRRRRGRGFSYHAADGKRIADRQEIDRLKALVVPPAYTDVWMSPYANSHLLAMGRDDRQRKQYQYHPQWQSQRAAKKYADLIDLGAALPSLWGWIARRLDDGKVGDQKAAIAAVLALIDRGSLRIGNESCVQENASYGATTLRSRHAEFDGNAVELDFSPRCQQHECNSLIYWAVLGTGPSSFISEQVTSQPRHGSNAIGDATQHGWKFGRLALRESSI